MSWLPSWLTGGIDADEEQARGDALDAQRKALNKAQLEAGKYDQAWYDQTIANDEASHINVNEEVNAAFMEGLNDGFTNVKGALKVPFKIIPWQLWVAGGIALFFYMGGFVWLKGILKR